MPRHPLPLRYSAYAASLLGLAVSLAGLAASSLWGWGVLGFGLLAALGSYDLLQRRHTVSRNYPILAHLRYNLESVGPEIRQYFIQPDTEEVPFSREQRGLALAEGVHLPCALCFLWPRGREEEPVIAEALSALEAVWGRPGA